MTEHWERCIRLKEPLNTRPFLIFAGIAGLGLLLGLYREVTGLGYVTGLNDGYSWGLFKNWNVTALTALGSGGYAVAVLAWIFNEKRFHPIMRTAVLTSLLGYGTGMLALDVENMPPFLEFLYKSNDPKKKELALKIFRFLQKTFPFGIAIAFVLPSMHQSSLGSLMYLAGPRVHPLWQTPMLPLFYLLMAYVLGFACVLLVLALSSYSWDLGWD